MFTNYQKSTGTSYTTTVAFVAAAVLSPALLAVSRPFGTGAMSVAIVVSAACLVLAWMNWRRSSQLSIPSLMNQKPVAK